MANYVNEENEVVNEVTTDKTSTKATRAPKTDRDSEIEALKAQIDLLTKLITAQAANSSAAVPQNSLTEEVTVVHLIQCFDGLSTHIELKNRTLDLTAFGETRTLDRREAEELAGKYRKFFERGVIAFGAGSENIAQRFDLKSVKDYEFYNSDFVKSLGFMSLTELEALYKKLGEAHKQFLIEYFKRKIRENDPNFNDISKIELLERLTREDDKDGYGAMEGVLIDRQQAANK